MTFNVDVVSILLLEFFVVLRIATQDTIVVCFQLLFLTCFSLYQKNYEPPTIYLVYSMKVLN